MTPFNILSAIAAPLRMMNVDTDIIIPKQFLRTIKRTGLGVNAFNDIRYNEDGSEKPDFVLNREPYRRAEILITGENFGCGSSREHAPWAILDFGIKCVIAPSFADIFYNNAFKNGILPLVLPAEQVEILMKQAEEWPDSPVKIDLEHQIIQSSNHPIIRFDIDPFRKNCLLNGLDDIGLTELKSKNIASFEDRDKTRRSWLY